MIFTTQREKNDEAVLAQRSRIRKESEDLFRRNNKPEILDYDKESEIPIIKCSICTGERVAGVKNLKTGKFKEIMLIRNNADMETFMQLYGLDSVKKEY